jgi:hypothetical protein
MHGAARFSALAALAATLFGAGALSAQKPDYSRADLMRVAARYVFGTSVIPRLIEDSVRFWYTSSARGDRTVTYVVDPRTASKRQLFDNTRLAAALSLAADTIVDSNRLPTFTVEDTAKVVELRMRRKVFRCTIATYACEGQDTLVWAMNRAVKFGPDYAIRSPDKKWDVFLYDYNLYARPAMVSDSESVARRDSVLRAATVKADTTKTVKADTTKKDSAAARPRVNRDSVALPRGSIQLTTDGVERYFYGSGFGDLFSNPQPPRWKPRRVPVAWSPDSKAIATERMDYRNVGRYALYSSTTTKPVDKSYYYAAAGDSVIPLTDVHVISVAERAVIASAGGNGPNVKAAGDVTGNIKIDQPPSPTVNFSTIPTWARSSDRLFVMSSARGYKRMTISAVDAKTERPQPLRVTHSRAGWSRVATVL